MDNKLLSVVVTSYNYEKYIGKTLSSLVSQTISGLEIIVVDDGSKDGSVDLIRDYCEQYPNIHLHQHEGGINKGLPASTKLGIEKATGRYIAFCESDDFWDKHHAEGIFSFIQKNPSACLIFNRIELIDYSSDQKRYGEAVSYTNGFLTEHTGQNIFLSLAHNHMPTFSAACIRRELLLTCDFNAFHPQYIDFWLWRQLCLRHPVHYVEDAVTYWRKHDESYDFTDHIQDTTDFLFANNELLKKQVSFAFSDNLGIALFKLFHKSRWKIIQYEMERIYQRAMSEKS